MDGSVTTSLCNFVGERITRLHPVIYHIVLTGLKKLMVFVCLMVFDDTFNNMSVISWRSVLLVEETVGPRESH